MSSEKFTLVEHLIWKFINPGLIKTERQYIYWVVPLSYFLFVSDILFAYVGVLPVGIKLMLNYKTENIQPMISVSSYISFMMIFLLAFGIIFQLPVAVLLLTKLGIITPKWLSKNRKYAILVIFILSGVITPGPDIFSQFMKAIPTLFLYGISILFSRMAN